MKMSRYLFIKLRPKQRKKDILAEYQVLEQSIFRTSLLLEAKGISSSRVKFQYLFSITRATECKPILIFHEGLKTGITLYILKGLCHEFQPYLGMWK